MKITKQMENIYIEMSSFVSCLDLKYVPHCQDLNEETFND